MFGYVSVLKSYVHDVWRLMTGDIGPSSTRSTTEVFDNDFIPFNQRSVVNVPRFLNLHLSIFMLLCLCLIRAGSTMLCFLQLLEGRWYARCPCPACGEASFYALRAHSCCWLRCCSGCFGVLQSSCWGHVQVLQNILSHNPDTLFYRLQFVEKNMPWSSSSFWITKTLKCL